MKPWRPPEWNKIRENKLADLEKQGLRHYPECCYEASADAMLEALEPFIVGLDIHQADKKETEEK